MLKKLALTLAIAGACSATSINLPFEPDLQAIGRIRQAIAESDLFGAKFTARFNGGPEIACFWGGLQAGACSEWFTVSMTRNLGFLNTFEVRNTSNALLTDFSFETLTFLGFRRGKHQMFGNLAIDLPGLKDTFGSGVGHALAGLRVKEFTLLNPLSEDLYGGVGMKVAIPGGQAFRFRGDVDELVASPEPATLALVSVGLAGIAWWRRKRNQCTTGRSRV
jgi:PEP-CTERM motif